MFQFINNLWFKGTIKVHEGDKVLDLIAKYKDVHNVYPKLLKVAKKAGLKADLAKGIFIAIN